MTDSLQGTAPGGAAPTAPPPSFFSTLWSRKLPHYPSAGARYFYLAIVVIATIVLYYELYVQGSVSTAIIAEYHMSFRFFVAILVVGSALGAFASLAAGLADRWGRTNMVVWGLLLTGALTLIVPHSPNRNVFIALSVLVALVEGTVLVATPALIRDFSPQLGRASAMGFWTLGPVIGSLVVTEVSSHTLPSHPAATDWRFQFYVCGIVGLVVFAIAFIGLRELSPQLRDQLMVSMRDRALIEAKAAGIKPEEMEKGRWRQMLRPSIVGSAFSISVFLLFYYIAVGFFVIYFATQWGYDTTKANNLANWYWISDAIALILTGIISDILKVRKPLMLIGAIVSAVGVAIFATRATEPSTSYYQFATLMAIIAASGGMAYCAWMAAFTETVEKVNPAATATGLAVWGWILRIIVTVSFAVLPFAVSATSPLVDHGAEVQALATQHHAAITTFGKLDAQTQAALAANPNDPTTQAIAVAKIAGNGVTPQDVGKATQLSQQYAQPLAAAQTLDPQTQAALKTGDQAAQVKAVGEISQGLKISPTAATALLQQLGQPDVQQALQYLSTTGAEVKAAGDALKAAGVDKATHAADFEYLQKYSPDVVKAQADSPSQWQRWWWVCFGGQIVFIPFIWLVTGRWSPRKARRDAEEHEKAVQAELAALHQQ